MRKEKYVDVRDEVKEMYDKLYDSFKNCGASESVLETIVFIFTIIFFLIWIIFDWKKIGCSFFIYIIFILFLFGYCIIVYYKSLKIFENKLGIKPNKVNPFVIFDAECIDKKISVSTLEIFYDYIDDKISMNSSNSFFTPIILTTILTILTNGIGCMIKDGFVGENIEKYWFVIPLSTTIYLLMHYILNRKNRQLLLFKKCLLHTKITYQLKGLDGK